MQLISFTIKNYRSIENLKFPIGQLDDSSFTYGLIGINEAGKSSILKALALLDDDNAITVASMDFQDKDLPVEVEYHYSQDDISTKRCLDELAKTMPETKIDHKWLRELVFKISFSLPDLTKIKSVHFPGLPDDEFKLQIEDALVEHIFKYTHLSVYWKSEDKYLISNEIILSEFALNPETVSIPLQRCFELCGYETKEKIQDLVKIIAGDSTEREDFQEKLGTCVTKLIKKVWPNHPIVISFNISGDTLNFHVKDANSKPKKTSQRSDGFKQFVSFLLNISAQKELKSLSNSLILLDEPETHLHPQAQEYFLKELISLTSADNNICIFATHSNYMVDKNHISRNFQVIKDESTDKTSIRQFDKSNSSYASVNFEVFGILDESYHNELYDSLRERYADKNGIEIEKFSIRAFDDQFLNKEKKLPRSYTEKGTNKVCLPTFIRNCIHYPANKKSNFTSKLQESISLLKSYI